MKYYESDVKVSYIPHIKCSLPQQRCIHSYGDSICIYPSDGVDLHLDPWAAQEDLGRMELGLPQGVETVY